ncbi:MAG: hypothetical protein R2788_20045 [Saprospiraceae bacterium]
MTSTKIGLTFNFAATFHFFALLFFNGEIISSFCWYCSKMEAAKSGTSSTSAVMAMSGNLFNHVDDADN